MSLYHTPATGNKCYIVESGEYEQRYIAGVFDSPERAMAAFPGKWTRTLWLFGKAYWQDWSSAGHTIHEEGFTSEGPETEPGSILRQRYNSATGGWLYDPITAEEAKGFLDPDWGKTAKELKGPWWKFWVRDSDEILEADRWAVTRAQWHNGFLATSANPKTPKRMYPELRERHERHVEEFRKRGLLVTKRPPGEQFWQRSFRSDFGIVVGWDRIKRPGAAS